jgi:hypothetical protein
MRRRIPLIAVVAAAMLASGCAADKPATQRTDTSQPAAATAQTSTDTAAAPAEATSVEAAPAPLPTLDANACVEITGANLNLAVAHNGDDARAAADKFGPYHPPADVEEAIEHFVSTGGAQVSDPDFQKYNSAIDNWIKQVCPL